MTQSLRTRLAYRLATLVSEKQKTDVLKQYVFDTMCGEMEDEPDEVLLRLLDEFLDLQDGRTTLTPFDFSP